MNSSELSPFFIVLEKGQIFYRVENSPRNQFDNPKFYSYWRDQTICDKEETWGKRCRGNGHCKFMELEALEDLRLINIPYKTVSFDDVSTNDIILADIFKKMADIQMKLRNDI